MRVIKVLNNSIILALDESGQECILMGKGIGFNKAIGYDLKKSDIEKVYILKDQNISKNIIRLAAEVDSKYFELAKMSIDYAVECFHMDLMEHIYLSLTDHLAFAVQRMEKGIILQNFYLPEMKRFNPNEFQVGTYTIEMMKEKLNINLPVDEAGNIAFHFINAQQNNPYNANNKIIIETVKDILDIIKYNFAINYDQDSVAYSRFITHLRLFVQRLLTNSQTPQEQKDILHEQITSNCTKEYACVKKVEIYIKEKFLTDLTEPEELYLTIHIHRILEEYNQERRNKNVSK